MNILSAEKISKSYSEKILLDEISLGISEGEKIGLIGINGAGKSTLLKMIAGIESPDSGVIVKNRGISIEYLPQNPDFIYGSTVLQQVFKGNSPVMRLFSEYHQILYKIEEGAGESQLESRLTSLSQEIERLGAWSLESEIKTVLTRLGIFDFEADVGKLSGGQRKRVALAGALLNPVELLILDEPTNHLDNDTIQWLESYLNSRKGALLMVTHDRYFLDRVVNRIIEVDNGKLYSYQGNYSKYLNMVCERLELEQSLEKKRRNLIRKELEWVQRGAKARSTKQKARLDRFQDLVDQKSPAARNDVEIKVGSARLGKKIVELEHVSKSYGEDKLISDFNYIFLRDDRVGIIGSNGVGKSTLLKMIAGRLTPDSGRVEAGDTVKIGFFSQENEQMDDSLRVIEYIREEAEYITAKKVSISASQMLETFLFPPDVQWTPISKLSGGEKRRLHLLRILMGAPNMLLLDEPTNDLDIQTLTVLESYLDDFPGTVVAVSHDRYFLDRIVNKIFSFQGNGIITQHAGSYSDYQRRAEDSALKSKEDEKNNIENKEGGHTDKKKERPIKFSYNEQREFEQIDAVIAELEEKLKGINTKVDEAAADFELLQQLLSEKEDIEDRLNNAIERWTYLNELAEKISEHNESKA